MKYTYNLLEANRIGIRHKNLHVKKFTQYKVTINTVFKCLRDFCSTNLVFPITIFTTTTNSVTFVDLQCQLES